MCDYILELTLQNKVNSIIVCYHVYLYQSGCFKVIIQHYIVYIYVCK